MYLTCRDRASRVVSHKVGTYGRQKPVHLCFACILWASFSYLFAKDFAGFLFHLLT